ncbi:hypothetical protein F511_43191 [Dorcoceras hygrometricum]|uniref:Uncharacterized protein n=1 Tax=Dorcoceras hygrometricum TaxID=472368 RepID=A0A2Z7BNR1_9LAMI|nr:hypothetical protein F511_43191 [Dorcoceras hygrometricum]
MNQLQALEEKDGPAGTSKWNQLEHLSGPSMMMSLVTTSCSADEERSAGARGPAGTEAEKKAIYAKATPLKKVDDVGATTALLQKYIDYTVHQQRENEKKDEAIDRH